MTSYRTDRTRAAEILREHFIRTEAIAQMADRSLMTAMAAVRADGGHYESSGVTVSRHGATYVVTIREYPNA